MVTADSVHNEFSNPLLPSYKPTMISDEDIVKLQLHLNKRQKNIVRSKDTSKKQTLGFSGMARSIAARWKQLDSDSKLLLENRALIDKDRYQQELQEWKKKQNQMKSSAHDELAGNRLTVHCKPVVFASEKERYCNIHHICEHNTNSSSANVHDVQNMEHICDPRRLATSRKLSTSGHVFQISEQIDSIFLGDGVEWMLPRHLDESQSLQLLLRHEESPVRQSQFLTIPDNIPCDDAWHPPPQFETWYPEADSVSRQDQQQQRDQDEISVNFALEYWLGINTAGDQRQQFALNDICQNEEAYESVDDQQQAVLPAIVPVVEQWSDTDWDKSDVWTTGMMLNSGSNGDTMHEPVCFDPHYGMTSPLYNE